MTQILDKPNPFIEHPAEGHRHLSGERWVFEFANGYGASVVRFPHSYGAAEGLWELAVLRAGRLTYATPITDDVLGHLTEADVRSVLRDVAELPAAR